MKYLTLQSERLKLRPITMQDAEAVHQLLSIPQVDQYNTLGIPESFDQTQKMVETHVEDFNSTPLKQYAMMIEQLDENKFIGLIALRLGKEKYRNAEVWFKLDPRYWGKGFATEALELIIHFGFNQLKLHRIEAGCAVNNLASVRVLEKAGMLREGCRQAALPLKSDWADNYEYAIIRSGYKSSISHHS